LSTFEYNKKKLFNDPVYGFISLPFDIVFDIIEHPYFQRLRRIKQLGLTHLVYPGALHTRFHHALGAMHLASKAIEVIRSKGHEITVDEAKAVCIALLLHDIGHGPFSHALEYSISKNITHEQISSLFMEALNKEFDGELDLAIRIFKNEYPKTFLHQLISSQLDMDRLDYLKRDSFFTGVSEGVVNSDRIISMLNVKNDQLCVEAKGIYSIEKFIIARRLMYWQVYLHKTVLSAENLIVNILKRAKFLVEKGVALPASKALDYFLKSEIDAATFRSDPKALAYFSALDDFDITAAIKHWKDHDDKVLAALCSSLLERKLYRIKISEEKADHRWLASEKEKLKQACGLQDDELKYFIFSGTIANNAYHPKMDKINLIYRDGELEDIANASDQLNISVLSEEVIKYFYCIPKQAMVEKIKNQRP